MALGFPCRVADDNGRGEDSDWSDFLQRGGDPDNPIQEHVFYVPKIGAEAAGEGAGPCDEVGDRERIVVKVRAGKAEEEFYETGQVCWCVFVCVCGGE
eukprot:1058632-Rhodomonas_salina.2